MSEMPKVPEVAQTISVMIKQINVRGWCQGMAFKDNGAVCVMGAAYSATGFWDPFLGVVVSALFSGPGDDFSRTILFLENVLCEYDPGAKSVSFWNDRPGRTVQEVI